jgi:hypothetical protein
MKAFLIAYATGLILFAGVVAWRSVQLFITAQPSLDDKIEVQAYMDKVDLVLSEYQRAQRDLLQVINQARAGNLLYSSPVWQLKLDTALLENMIVADKIKAIEAPPSMQKIHADLLLGADELLSYTQAMERWLENQKDADALATADKKSRAAGDALLRVKMSIGMQR